MMNERHFPSTDEITSLQLELERLGPRLTGSKAHQAFIDFLSEQIRALQLEVKEDIYQFDMWEADEAALRLENSGTSIPVASVFPYSGETPPDGITAEVVFCKSNRFAKAKGKIACVEVAVSDVPSSMVFKPRRRYPEQLPFRKKYNSPLVTSFLKAPDLKKAAEAGVLGVICIWKRASSANVRGQYLPFTTPYQGLPAIWVEEAYGEKLLETAKIGGRVNLKLSAVKTENAVTKTIYTLLPGENPQEILLINTHTDGPNAVEENGPLALLALLYYYKRASVKPKRSLMFVFTTGHFQLPQLGVEDRQATSRWLRDHPEYWDGKDGHATAVAGVTVEHLGCMEWHDTPDKRGFEPTGRTEPELVYTANEALSQIYLQTVAGRSQAAGLTLRPRNGIYLGEGQPLYQAGIPTISFIPVPDYLCRLQGQDEEIQVNIELMHEQIKMILKLIMLLDQQSVAAIGKLQKPSFGLW